MKPVEEVQGGKVSRIKKANKWTEYAKDTINDGITIGAHGYEEF